MPDRFDTYPDGRPDDSVLTGDCETDCADGCAYPGRFAECTLGGLEDITGEIQDLRTEQQIGH